MSNFEFAKLKPEAAIKFFEQKGYALGFDWRDVWKEEHAIAFTVAKATSLDILTDIRSEIDKALKNGETFESFKENLYPKLAEKGWWGKKLQTDPLTGEVKQVQLGSVKRLQTIYYTNIDMAYSAGMWDEIEQTKKTHPYLQYKNLDGRARAEHRAWNEVLLPVDDPWWDSHYPPNGWHCRCRVRQVAKYELDSGKLVLKNPPKEEYVKYKNKRTGEVTSVPKGISPGFDYNVGKARAKAFVPPPAGGLPKTVQSSSQLPSMPKVNKVPADAVLPTDLSDIEYMKAFLHEFGADIGKTTFFEDKARDVIPIDDNLFKASTGFIKVNKYGRGQYMKLLALGLKEPDEIWLQWEKAATGAWLLKRRYIKIWEIEKGSHCLTVFDKTKDGWVGTTTFPPKHDKSKKVKDDYINKFRDGLLLFRALSL